MADEVAQSMVGLPISDLIVTPLVSVAEGQAALNEVALNYLDKVGFDGEGDDKKVKTIPVGFDQVIANDSGSYDKRPVSLDIPLMTLVNLPNVGVSEAEIDFTMEVKTQDTKKSSTDASVTASASYGGFLGKASISGSVSTHRESTRSTDKTAKYNINVKAKQLDPTEGMSRVLDLLTQGTLQPMSV
jgi:hypothetical protein